MENLKTILASLSLLLIMALLTTEGRQPVLHRVGGGRFTWKPNVNFTEWAIHEQFYVGDWLYFGFDKQLYSVLQVNKTSYYKCIEGNFINNITRGGRDVFNLTEAKPYYFISGRGYCFKGMKVAINVQEYSPPTTNGSLPITITSAGFRVKT
ncbi:Plastocyanin-like protein [Corchorus capsularis]|uniref:Plastocyanin-like protein n=1 Tax=Corchorus capsularis TaxID=210143 RepID=A0A1R3HB74_COCAP|nr:Plastocyanin-like protein [Corchorus capsularis]